MVKVKKGVSKKKKKEEEQQHSYDYDDEDESYDGKELKPLPVSFQKFARSVISITNGNITEKVSEKKKAQFKARLRELTLRLESSIAEVKAPNFQPIKFDLLPSANKQLRETEISIKQQVLDIKSELKGQQQYRDETQQYIDQFKTKSDNAKKAHKSSHRSQLHPSLRKFADTDPDNFFDTFDFSNTHKDSTEEKDKDEEEEEEDNEEEEMDKELEEVKSELAPKLAKIAKAQRSAEAAIAKVAQAHDIAQVLLSGPNES